MRGFGAGHERRHDVQVQKEIAVPPVRTCSCFTNAESWQPGHGGGVGSVVSGDEDLRRGGIRNGASLSL